MCVAAEPLPVLRAREQIVQAMAGGGAMVLAAATGSGKTTQVPQIMLHAGVEGSIVVLEPRRLAARLTARRVAQELGCQLGDVVGFQTRFERAIGPATRIRFVTEGVFLRQAQRDPLLRGVGAVLLDEFHERSLFADLALGLVRHAREARGGAAHGHPPLAVAAMSATMDTQAVARYLGAPVIQAEGRAFPVEVRYEAGDAKAPVWDRAARAVRALLEEQPEGDALVFMAGAYEIDRTLDAVRAQLRGMPGGAQVDVVGLHGSMPPDRQDAAVAPAAAGRRKVIVATNVAETSITIPGVRMVVDAGQARVFRADPRRGLNALRVEAISQASADQRAGRAGRTAPGVCVRLWSQREHAQRPAADTPEVQRVDLAEAMLMVEAGGVAFESFPWLDAPTQDAVQQARRTLELVGAVEAGAAEEGAAGRAAGAVAGAAAHHAPRVTALGRALAKIPAHPRLGRSLLAAAELGVLQRVARWCALVGERDVVQAGGAAQLVRLTPDGEAPGDVACREALVQRVEQSGFRITWHEGVEPSVAACRQVVAAARELEDAARAAGGGRTDAAAPRAPAERAGDTSAARAPAALAGDTSAARASQAMLAGFPDHVAWRMDAQRPHCAMAGRRKVSLAPDTVVRSAGFLLALEVREGGRGDQVHQSLALVQPLERAWVEAVMPERFAQRVETRFCEDLQAPAEFEETLFDGTVIAQVVRPLRGRQAAAAAHGELADRVARGEIRPAAWNDDVDQWLARVRCVAEWFPEKTLRQYDEQDLAVLAAEIAHGCAKAADLDQRPVLDIMRSALSWEEQQFVERAAPAAITLPNGRRMKLEYQPGKPPVGRTKIQDLYDFKGHPSVANGRVKVRLELLGPNFRPVQITDDLPGFWERLYPEVKKELKRRYPRHEWR